MESEKCRALLYAIEKGNLAETADALGYTTSGISRMIASLEKETGFLLLERSRYGVAPTKECEMMLPVIQELVRAGDRYRQHADDICGIHRGVVRVGTAYSSFYRILSQAIADFSETYPEIRIEIQEDFSSILLSRMERHELDLCLISEREGSHAFLELMQDPMIVWVPESWPQEKETYSLSSFETDPFIEIYPGEMSDNARTFRKYQIKPNVRYSALTTLSAFSMVEAGLGVTLTNGVYADQWKGNVRILQTDPAVYIPIGLASPNADTLSPAARRFKDHLIPYLTEKK